MAVRAYSYKNSLQPSPGILLLSVTMGIVLPMQPWKTDVNDYDDDMMTSKSLALSKSPSLLRRNDCNNGTLNLSRRRQERVLQAINASRVTVAANIGYLLVMILCMKLMCVVVYLQGHRSGYSFHKTPILLLAADGRQNSVCLTPCWDISVWNNRRETENKSDFKYFVHVFLLNYRPVVSD